MSDKNVQESIHPEGNPEKFSIQHTWSLKIAYLIAAGLLALLFVDPSKLLHYKDPLEGSIAIVLEKSGDVKRKHPRASSWSAVKKDEKLYPNSMIFTGRDSYVKIALIDASIINQKPESLLRLRIASKKKKKKPKKKVDMKSDSPPDPSNGLDDSLQDEGEYEEGSGISLELDGGDLDIKASGDIEIRDIATRDTSIKLTKGSELNIKNSEGGDTSEIAVKSGIVNVTTNTAPQKKVVLKKGDKINTKKLRDEQEKADQEVVERIKKGNNATSAFAEAQKVQRKGIIEIVKEIGKIILFMD